MMSLRPIPSLTLPSIPVLNTSARFPVGRIFCIGRNYAAHAREMGDDGRKPPFHFTKSPFSLIGGLDDLTMPYPPMTEDLHHEVELVIALHAGGRNLTLEQAKACVWGFGLGLDMTRRDLQREAKASGRPWAASKDFEGAALCGPLSPVTPSTRLDSGAISLDLNTTRVQEGDLSHMIWSVPEILVHLSTLMPLQAGDLIYTGTPAGVGPVRPGDVLVAHLDGHPSLTVKIAP